MKIVHIFFTLEVGGSETMMIDIMNRQVETQDVSLIIINRENNKCLLSTISPKIKQYIIGRKLHSHNPIPVIRLNRLIQKIGPDVVHLHNRRIMPLLLFKNSACRYVFTAHTITDIIQPKRFDKIFAISEYVKSDLISRYGERVPIEVIYNGIDTTSVVEKKKYFTSDEIFNIVQVGRLAHQVKGQDILIDAVSKVIKEKEQKIRLCFIGDGESKEYLLEKCHKSDIEKHVTFLGAKSREYIYAHLHSYDLLVQSSREEGFGLTIAEAMAAGVPVLISNIDGPLEVINQGKYGDVFAVDNVTDCADKITEIISTYNLRIENVKLAKKFVCENFDINKTAQNYIDRYLV